MGEMDNTKLKTPQAIIHDRLPAVLTIAGSDSSGGAGIEADLKTLSAHKVYGLTCITALTAQNTKGVKLFHKTPTPTLKDILQQNFDDILLGYSNNDAPLKTIKTGMLTEEAVNVLHEYIDMLDNHHVKLIVDPVMISSSGSSLFDSKGMVACTDKIVRHAYLVTPNFHEALALLSLTETHEKPNVYTQESFITWDQIINLTKTLQNRLECENILLKGGHIPWNIKTNQRFNDNDPLESKRILDILYESKAERLTIYESHSIESPDSHGTGCTLSSSIAANLAKNIPLKDSIGLSIDYVHKGLVNMAHKIGHGNGPLNHLVSPETNINQIVINHENHEAQNISPTILADSESFLQFFKCHPKIQPNWNNYIRHDFIKLLAVNKLPFEKFLYFLKQDYYYLINYAQIHGLSSSVAPSYHQTHSEALIISNIVNEIEKHKQKLSKNYNIIYERDIDLDIDLTPGKACQNYCDYLLKIGKTEDFLGIKVALAPCLHGYYEAGMWGVELRKKHDGALNELSCIDHSQVYDEWISDYSSDWYYNAYQEGKEALQDLLETTLIGPERLEQLIDIFNTVTKLEVAFWDEILQK